MILESIVSLVIAVGLLAYLVYTEVLGSGRLMSVAEMARLQNDNLSIPARAMVPLLRDVTLNNATSAKAREMLLGWDFVMDKNSIPGRHLGMFQRRFSPTSAT